MFDAWDRHRLQKFSRVLEPLHWLHSTMPIFIAVYFSIASINAAERFSDWTSLIDRKSTSKSWSIWKRPPRGFVSLYFLFSPLFYQQLQFDRAWARVSAQVTLFLCFSLINRESTGVRRKTPSISAFYSEVGREPYLVSSNSRTIGGAGMAQWCELSPLINVVRVRFPDPASNVGWVCWFSTLHR